MGRPGLIAIAGAVVIAALAGLRECGTRRSADRVFAAWMSRNCAVGERGVLERELERYGSRLEPRLEQAFLEGPPAAEKAQWLRIAERERVEVSEAIQDGRTYGLDKEEISRLADRSRAPVSTQVLEDAVEGYRSAALAGLAVIGTDRARQFLDRIGRDPAQRQYWDVAGLLLKRAARPRR